MQREEKEQLFLYFFFDARVDEFEKHVCNQRKACCLMTQCFFFVQRKLLILAMLSERERMRHIRSTHAYCRMMNDNFSITVRAKDLRLLARICSCSHCVCIDSCSSLARLFASRIFLFVVLVLEILSLRLDRFGVVKLEIIHDFFAKRCKKRAIF